MGPKVVEPSLNIDERGCFSRLFCEQAFSEIGIEFNPLQTSLSRNTAIYTLRGMHDQPEEWAEAKLIRITRGAVYDVAVDLRPQSPTFLKWCATILSADNLCSLYIPKGFSHGFLTLQPDTDVLYMIDRRFKPGHGRGFRWNDPAFGIDWPNTPAVISDRDATYLSFEEPAQSDCI